MITKASVDSFLNSKNFAVVGVSGKSSKFGNTIYKELKKKGMSVFGVNPNLENFDGDRCYKNLKDLQGKIDAVVNVVSPLQTLDVVKEAHSIW